jgi:hypothetical protein
VNIESNFIKNDFVVIEPKGSNINEDQKDGEKMSLPMNVNLASPFVR